MDFKNIVLSFSNAKLASGKFRPKFNKFSIVVTALLFILLGGTSIGLIYALLSLNLNLILACGCGIFGLMYIILINPYTQNKNNYYIEFESENSLANFKLYYKNKLVNIKYKIDNNGKIAFANNESKLSCVSYADGTKMSKLTKFRVMNYFIKWLNDYNLMSDEITTTFE